MIDLDSNPLVETDWLAENLSNTSLRIVDARWRADDTGYQLYQAGHIPGAVHVCWHNDLNHTADGVRDLIAPPDRFAEVMASRGISSGTPVIAYAETDHSGAARLWWALKFYGHDQVAVLNGGITKWVAEGRPLSTEVPRPSMAHFTPRVRPQWIATADEIQAALDRKNADVCIIDARPPEQYAGQAVWTPKGSRYIPAGESAIEVGGRRPIRGGHIPGAIHLHAGSTNLNERDWTYLPPETLRQRALAAGVKPDQRIVTYCGCGISASLGLFALHLAGFKDLALYDASWEEWGTDPARPIE